MAVVDSTHVTPADSHQPSGGAETWKIVKRILRPIASLKLTVALFAAAIAIILIGTLAQVEKEMWQVMEQYFYPWVAKVEASILFPRTWAPNSTAESKAATLGIASLVGGGIVSFLLLLNVKEGVSRWLLPASVMGLCGYVAIFSWATKAFYFPGGATIGLAMSVNLIAAHLVRFGIQAKGSRLMWGTVVSVIGIALTAGVIVNGHNHQGLQGEPPFSWQTLWAMVKSFITVCAIGGFGWLAASYGNGRWRRPEFLLLGVLTILTAGTAIFLWASGERSYLGDSGMRVLWQLIQAALVGFVLCVGSFLLFKKRSGVVVLHAGVLLMMFGQWFVSQYDVEEQITVWEGETVDWAHDIRRVELAIIDKAKSADKDDVTAIPLMANGTRSKYLDAKRIEHESLPFNVEVLDYFINSSLKAVDKPTKATKGHGKTTEASAAKEATGTDSFVNQASVYVRITDKDSDEDLGTYLLSQVQMQQGRGPMASLIEFDKETVEVGDKEFDIQLRFKRNYKPYSVNLVDVTREDYVGTTTPRVYASVVRLKDEEHNFDRELKIWMNNPQRYAGETFYQSGYIPFGSKEATTLQVVRNSGWMIPYVSCVVVGEGMLLHFFFVLLRFLNRRSSAQTLIRYGLFSGGVFGVMVALLGFTRQKQIDGKPNTEKPQRKKKSAPERFEIDDGTSGSFGRRLVGAIFPWVMVSLCAMMLYSAAKEKPPEAEELHLEAFGELPLLYEGRTKPFDTLARNTLRVLSGRESFKARYDEATLKEKWPTIEKKLKKYWSKIADKDISKYQSDIPGLVDFIEEETKANREQVVTYVDKNTCETQPAIRWLLDMASGAYAARDHKVFRIDNQEVLDTLGLNRRKGYRYSLEEILPGMKEFDEQRALAARQAQEDDSKLSLFQKKILELGTKFRIVSTLRGAFLPPELPSLPSAEEFRENRQLAAQRIQQFRNEMELSAQRVMSTEPPLTVYDATQEKWVPYSNSWAEHFVKTQLLGEQPQASFGALNKALVAYLQAEEGPAKERVAAVKEFNSQVAIYQEHLQNEKPTELVAQQGFVNSWVEKRFDNFYQFEAFFNKCSPFFYCQIFYILAFVLALFGWLGFAGTLNRSAFLVIVFTLIVHTLALGARIYISGRPPVTNLYSSAVFIGWSAVILGVGFELLFRNGVCNVIAGVSGFASLVIAHSLAGDGDTFVVLRAVLDTQFWLATHVVCITLGYGTTFFAGFLGVIFAFRNWFDRSFDAPARREMDRMIYGTLCFSILLSFIGTVLGGLWADDSWGRFWGWDPKENGALIIVLWNALVLHAKWDGWGKGRVLSMLAMGGNIVTLWSWFGVNELGVGLHSYGFTEGTLWNLAIVFFVQLVVMALAAAPFRAADPDASEAPPTAGLA